MPSELTDALYQLALLLITVTTVHAADVRFENRWRLFDLIREAREVLQLIHCRFRVLHALRRCGDLVAQVVRILPADAHLHECLDLRLDAIELDRHDVDWISRQGHALQSDSRPGS